MTKSRLSPRQRFFIAVGGVLLTVAVLAAVCAYRSYLERRDHSDSASCANHFIQLRMNLAVVASDHPDLVLSATNDTCSALLDIFKNLPDDTGYQSWLNMHLSACPESFRRNRSIGYVYVGDGLKLSDVVHKDILILFCPSENHRRFDEHSHAWNCADGICVLSNEAMIAVLQSAIAKGKSGEVPYSVRAMAALGEQLNRRLKSATFGNTDGH